jgi:hypothetical protein
MGTVTHQFGKTTIKAFYGSRLEVLCLKLKEEFPELKMVRKRDCWWQWIIHVLLVIITLGFNRRYISGFTTTGKNKIYWSDKRWRQLMSENSTDHDRAWSTLSHEQVHLRQFRDKGVFVMAMLWLIPPILFCYGRAIVIEKPGYLKSLQCMFELDRAWAEHPAYRKWWIGQFTGINYGFMWVIKSQVAEWFDDELARLRKEENKPWIYQ